MRSLKDKIFVAITKTIPLWGKYFRLAVRIPLLGKTVGPINKLVGRLLPQLAFLGFRKEASFENAVQNYKIFLKLIGAQYDVEETSPQSRPFIIHKCPAGHCCIEHLDACNATMELNHSLVENSGAILVVDKRSPLDGICVERVVKK